MIINLHTFYPKYLNQTNDANKQYNSIQIITLRSEQKTQIRNNKKNKAKIFIKAQEAKLNQYIKMIDILQNVFPNKKN